MPSHTPLPSPTGRTTTGGGKWDGGQAGTGGRAMGSKGMARGPPPQLQQSWSHGGWSSRQQQPPRPPPWHNGGGNQEVPWDLKFLVLPTTFRGLGLIPRDRHSSSSNRLVFSRRGRLPASSTVVLYNPDPVGGAAASATPSAGNGGDGNRGYVQQSSGAHVEQQSAPATSQGVRVAQQQLTSAPPSAGRHVAFEDDPSDIYYSDYGSVWNADVMRQYPADDQHSAPLHLPFSGAGENDGYAGVGGESRSFEPAEGTVGEPAPMNVMELERRRNVVEMSVPVMIRREARMPVYPDVALGQECGSDADCTSPDTCIAVNIPIGTGGFTPRHLCAQTCNICTTEYCKSARATCQDEGAEEGGDVGTKEYLNGLVAATVSKTSEQMANIAFVRTHKTASTTLAYLLFIYAKRHKLKVGTASKRNTSCFGGVHFWATS
eukprot:g17333.t1